MTVNEGVTADQALSATDADGQALTFSFGLRADVRDGDDDDARDGYGYGEPPLGARVCGTAMGIPHVHGHGPVPATVRSATASR